MTQHVLLILREGETPRILGPYALAAGALAEATIQELREGEFLVQPLEPPRRVRTRGRHELIPSPVPRDVVCQSCGRPFLPTHSIAAPGPTTRHPFKPTAAASSPEGRAVVAGALEETDPIPDHLAHAIAAVSPSEHFGQLRTPPGQCTRYRNLPCTCEAENRMCWRAEAVSDWEKKKRAAAIGDLSAGGRPITSWVDAHADQLRRSVPPELPTPPKEIEP